MKITKSSCLTENQKEIIVQLWNAEYPQQLAYSGIGAFDEFLNNLGNPQHFLLNDETDKIKGWLALFMRDDEIWFSMIVDSSEQRKGFGTALLNLAKESANEINGWAIDHDKDVKTNGEKYLSPIEFYRKNGFEILLDVRIENGNVSAVKIKWKSNINLED